ncbi:MAG: hypothetical protein L0G94_10545 [Brachybacterium sp.]|uniref:hypothetical protein n=1 Tax=Brachybacterium sp. TaxID=1891286 RepID=UPI002647FC54|nr:hypothetical protein [Brachybacterium sp.]MDN5687094.1 hypothetical protein [Brachybacterium sp.]
MSAVARHTDPITSHEAAEGVDLMRSQMLVLTFAKQYMGQFFTDKALVATYHRVREVGENPIPPLSDSRIRTARMELAAAQLVFFAGYTLGTVRRERIWTLEPSLAKEA